MTTTDLLLVVLMVIGSLIFRQLRALSERLKSHLDQVEADAVLSHKCPKLFFIPRRRPGLRAWYREMFLSTNAPSTVWWRDFHKARLKQYASEQIPGDISLELAASQGNNWARYQLLARASEMFLAGRWKGLGLSRMEAGYLLDDLWREDSEEAVPFLGLGKDEWQIDGVLSYVITTDDPDLPVDD